MNRIVQLSVALIAAATLYTGFYLNDRPDEPQTEPESVELKTAPSETSSSDTVPVFSLRDFNNAIVDIAERTNPSVVTITTSRTVRQQQSPFSFFFNEPGFDSEQEEERQGSGSGVIVTTDGYILTNNHVIDRADEITIQLFDGSEVEVEVVGTDPTSDLAVLKASASDLPALPMGDSDALRVGEMVLAIGSPFGQQFAHTVSKGIVSAKGRSGLRLADVENYIQTDAAINPGNSGGALINMDGELIGINTAIASRTGGNQGIGFAIPVNMARTVMEALIEDGRVVRGFVGIFSGNMVDGVMARALGMDEEFGAIVGRVSPDGPADRAGIQEGDVLLRKDGEPIRDWFRFRSEIMSTAPGTEVEFEVFRDGEKMNVMLTLGEVPDEEVAEVAPEAREDLEEALGFTLEELSDSIRRQLNLQSGVEGVVVAQIRNNSRAYRQGLRRGDVITQVQNLPVTGSDEFYGAIESLIQSGEEVALLRVVRGPQNLFIAFELPAL
ncbi:MAG: Do family serine endopeptidase [Balneolaceae bacterium]